MRPEASRYLKISMIIRIIHFKKSSNKIMLRTFYKVHICSNIMKDKKIMIKREAWNNFIRNENHWVCVQKSHVT